MRQSRWGTRCPSPLNAAALLATKGAYAQGLVLFFTTVGFLWWFDRWASRAVAAATTHCRPA